MERTASKNHRIMFLKWCLIAWGYLVCLWYTASVPLPHPVCPVRNSFDCHRQHDTVVEQTDMLKRMPGVATMPNESMAQSCWNQHAITINQLVTTLHELLPYIIHSQELSYDSATNKWSIYTHSKIHQRNLQLDWNPVQCAEAYASRAKDIVSAGQQTLHTNITCSYM